MNTTKQKQEQEKAKNVFFDYYFENRDFDSNSEKIDRYQFTKIKLDKADYGKEEMSDEEFAEWADENLDYEELYDVPMMNTLRYFPSCVSFSEDDRYKVAANTCLLYDAALEQWAVGMTGSGMDLRPYLLETFINLGRGVPREIADAINKEYSAGLCKEQHQGNCELLARAYEDEAEWVKNRAKLLKA